MRMEIIEVAGQHVARLVDRFGLPVLVARDDRREKAEELLEDSVVRCVRAGYPDRTTILEAGGNQ